MNAAAGGVAAFEATPGLFERCQLEAVDYWCEQGVIRAEYEAAPKRLSA